MRLHLNMRNRIIAIVFTLVMLGGSTYLVASRRHSVKQPASATPSSKDIVTSTDDTPSETPLPKTYTSTAGPLEPKYIRLPTINAEGYIQKMGVDQHNQVAAPSNVNLAGWYVNSLRPGETGLSIIDGHVNGLHGPGIFLRLSKLVAGDIFTIELGNGTQKTFKVARVTNTADTDASAALFSKDKTITSQLNLITCGGTFDRQSHTYTQRTIVVSELIP